MPSAYDVAAYILERCGPMSTWKLQKLVYYSQAWHLVWKDNPLFQEEIEAWANGPVIPDLYREHRGYFNLSRDQLARGESANLSDEQRQAIDAVLNFYGDKSGQWLSELTHAEAPWLRAREGFAPTQRGSRTIELNDMAEYYGGL
jgi:uncharacterized phage-associated protein